MKKNFTSLLLNSTKKNFLYLASFLVLFLPLFHFTLSVHADTIPEESIGFYVNAILPENQVDSSKTYYDLRVFPDMTQHLELEIHNTSDQDIVVEIDINDASSNSAGEVEYKITDVNDEYLQFRLRDILSIPQHEVIIPAGQIAVVPLQLNMPSEPLKGEMIGSIVVTKQKNETSQTSGVSLSNVYSYVVGVRLTQEDFQKQIVLDLESVSLQQVNYRSALVYQLANPEPYLLNSSVMDIKVYWEQESEPCWQTEKQNLKMAPSSTMFYALYVSPESVRIGNYHTVVTINGADGDWIFEQDFEINREVLDTIQSMDEVASSSSWINKLLVIVSVLLVLLILLVVYFILKTMRKKEDQ